MTAKLINRFNTQLDELLGLSPKSVAPENEVTLQTANLLHGMDFDAEISPRAGIKSKWEQQFQRSSPILRFPSGQARRLPASRWVWVSILIILLALLTAFRQPVFAAVSRLFGYIFVSDVGFLPMDSTYMLEQPILQEHNGQTVTVTRGVATPQNIILFLEFNDTAHSVDGAWLEISSGEKLELAQWQYWPNIPGSRSVQLIFPPLPSGTTQTTLTLLEGWHLPLNWIPASQSNLPDARAVPYVSVTQETASSSDLCVEKHGMNLCVPAATSSAENVSVLLKAESRNPDLISGGMMMGLTWQTESALVTLRDEQGNVFPMIAEQNGTLTFPSLAVNQKVTLTVPLLLATVDIPDQNIIVDMGADPQPDTVIPLDASIQVLGATVHFSKATFVGDGVNSLRLTLNADEPIQTVDGLTPASLEVGKPDRIDDLYGTGMLAGSKDIFIELIRPNGKITGMLTIPIISAAVIVDGPFEFTFNLTDASSPPPTPAQADPNIFSPAPTPTPLPLDSYFFSGQTLETGDLLYAVWNGDQTNVYRIAPNNNQPVLFMTLPGHAYSLYLHPDHQGLNYLAGKYNPDNNSIDNARVYVLRFNESKPRLLPVTPNRMDYPTWSYDGRLLAFNAVMDIPGGNPEQIGWIDLNCEQAGDCPIQYLNTPAEFELYAPEFSFDGYLLAINGANSETGAGDIYLTQFDENLKPTEIQNLTNTSQYGDEWAAWISGKTLAWVCGHGNPGNETSSICLKDLLSNLEPQIIFSFDDWYRFGISPNGNFFWQNTINRQVGREMQMWLYPRKGLGKNLMISAPAFDMDYGKPSFSEDEQHLAFVSTTENFKIGNETLYIINTSNGQELIKLDSPSPIGWLGWVR